MRVYWIVFVDVHGVCRNKCAYVCLQASTIVHCTCGFVGPSVGPQEGALLRPIFDHLGTSRNLLACDPCNAIL